MTPIRPLVGVVVVNFHGDDRTVACIERLGQLTWPADGLEVVVVDNGSEPGFAAQVAAIAPGVRVIGTGRNLGFAGGCNVGLRALAHCDYIALLNNDALPDRDWLEPLVHAIESTGAGAATPKVLLDGRFAEVRLTTMSAAPPGGDPRELGVQLSGVRVGGRDVLEETQLRSGFWGWESDEINVGGRFSWTSSEAVLLVPLEDPDPARLELRLSCGHGVTEAEVLVSDQRTLLTVGIEPSWSSVGGISKGSHLVNNTGMVLLADGSTADRGFLELDQGQFDEPTEVFGWSAAAVLLSQGFVRDVGLFDDRFFLYYEDADLSWRGRLNGWSYHYVPTSLVWHEHSATVGEGSQLGLHLLARNRLLMLTKNAPAKLARAAVGELARDLVSAFRRDVLRRVVTGRRPIMGHVAQLARVAGGYGRLLPGTLAQRRRIRQPRAGRDGDVLAWAGSDAPGPGMRVGRENA
jgi:GT2 family glycosyltransferase